METSEGFSKKVGAVWDDPYEVAKVAMLEALQCGAGLDDPTSLARRVGVLAGLTTNGTVRQFVELFNEQILDEE